MILGYINANDSRDFKIQKRMLQDFNCDKIMSENINGSLNDEALQRFHQSDHSHVRSIVICNLSVMPFTVIQTMKLIVSLSSEGIKLTSIHDPFLCSDTIESLLFLKSRRSYRKSNFRNTISKGRPNKILTNEEKEALQETANLYLNRKDLSIDEIMRISGFKHRSTFYRKLASIGVFPETQKGRLRKKAFLEATSKKHRY